MNYNGDGASYLLHLTEIGMHNQFAYCHTECNLNEVERKRARENSVETERHAQ